jgi:large subunit ribosomal protein L23
MKSIYDVIRRPVISEKSTALAEVGSRYVFEVPAMTNKDEIRNAVERLFNVKVKKVRTMIMHGKVKTAGGARIKRANWKKAIVTVQEGQKIEFFGAN